MNRHEASDLDRHIEADDTDEFEEAELPPELVFTSWEERAFLRWAVRRAREHATSEHARQIGADLERRLGDS